MSAAVPAARRRVAATASASRPRACCCTSFLITFAVIWLDPGRVGGLHLVPLVRRHGGARLRLAGRTI